MSAFHARAPSDDGQSLVEFALALPLLLVLLLGIADVGRVYYYTTLIANAAREGAVFAARTPAASDAAVAQRACNETGLSAYGSACPTEFMVTRTSTAEYARVVATYDFTLLTGAFAGSILGINPLRVRAQSELPILAAQ